MIERRRSKRLGIDLALTVSTLYKQDDVVIENINSPIEVVNISRYGIGFKSKSNFPIGYYFNAALKFGSLKDTLYCVVKILRSSPIDGTDLYSCGCEFVGMPDILDYFFEEYEADLKEAGLYKEV